MSEVRQLQRRVEALEREVVELRRRIGNMPVRPVRGVGGAGGGQGILYYSAYLPDAYTFLQEYGDGLSVWTTPTVYLGATSAYYRLVAGAVLTTPAGSWPVEQQYRWASLTLPVSTSAGTNGILAGETHSKRVASSGKALVLYYHYGAKEAPYVSEVGPISTATEV